MFLVCTPNFNTIVENAELIINQLEGPNISDPSILHNALKKIKKRERVSSDNG